MFEKEKLICRNELIVHAMLRFLGIIILFLKFNEIISIPTHCWFLYDSITLLDMDEGAIVGIAVLKLVTRLLYLLLVLCCFFRVRFIVNLVCKKTELHFENDLTLFLSFATKLLGIALLFLGIINLAESVMAYVYFDYFSEAFKNRLELKIGQLLDDLFFGIAGVAFGIYLLNGGKRFLKYIIKVKACGNIV